MDELFFAFANSITSLVLCMAVGFVCHRKQLLTSVHISGLTDLLIRVAMPATIFTALMRPFSRDLLIDSLTALLIFLFLIPFGGFLGWLLAKLLKASDAEREAWQFGSSFGNFGFMGIPVVLAVFGIEGLIFVTSAMIATNILSFTYGVRIFKNAPRQFKIMEFLARSPAVPAAMLGYVMFLTGLRFPSPIESSIELLAGITAPVSMIVIGAVLAKENLKEAMLDTRLIPHTLLRLAILPIMTYFALSAVFGSILMVYVLTTLMAMPVGAMTVILAEKYAKNAQLAARFVVVTTLLSAITMPVLSLMF